MDGLQGDIGDWCERSARQAVLGNKWPCDHLEKFAFFYQDDTSHRRFQCNCMPMCIHAQIFIFIKIKVKWVQQ